MIEPNKVAFDEININDSEKDRWDDNFEMFKFYCCKGYEFRVGIEPTRVSIWTPILKKKENELKNSISSNPKVIGPDFKCAFINKYVKSFIGCDDCDKERTRGSALLFKIDENQLLYLLISENIYFFEAKNEIVYFGAPIHSLEHEACVYHYAIDKDNILYAYGKYMELTEEEVKNLDHFSISEVPYYLEIEKRQGSKFENLLEFAQSFSTYGLISKQYEGVSDNLIFNSDNNNNVKKNGKNKPKIKKNNMKQKGLNSKDIKNIEEKIMVEGLISLFEKADLMKNHRAREKDANTIYDLCCDFPEIDSKKELIKNSAFRKLFSQSTQHLWKFLYYPSVKVICASIFRDFKERKRVVSYALNLK